MLCDTLIENDRRRVILSSIVRVFNNSLVSLVVLQSDSSSSKPKQQIAKIDVNKDVYLPIDLLYANPEATLFFGTDA